MSCQAKRPERNDKVRDAKEEDNLDIMAVEEEDKEKDKEEEASHKKRKVTFAPTQKEIEEHRKSHIPYTERCRSCVAGRARGAHTAQARPRTQDSENKEASRWRRWTMHS